MVGDPGSDAATPATAGTAGSAKVRLAKADRKRLAQLVDRAETATGLQVVLYVGPTEDDPGAHADQLLARAGAAGPPAVLLLVALDTRRLEVRTAPDARSRIPDEAASEAVAAMTSRLAEGDLVGGVESGLAVLVRAAGPAAAGAVPGPELPDVLGR